MATLRYTPADTLISLSRESLRNIRDRLDFIVAHWDDLSRNVVVDRVDALVDDMVDAHERLLKVQRLQREAKHAAAAAGRVNKYCADVVPTPDDVKAFFDVPIPSDDEVRAFFSDVDVHMPERD